MCHSDTLLFAHTQSSIDENNWRLLFNNPKVIKNQDYDYGE
jgi:hypothetical protein